VVVVLRAVDLGTARHFAEHFACAAKLTTWASTLWPSVRHSRAINPEIYRAITIPLFFGAEF
jgi:hypothetical protein